jgi:hypothetical protein
LKVRLGASGACPSTTTDGTALDAQSGDTWFAITTVPQGSWCLSFFAVRATGVASAPTTREIIHGPRPA